MKSCSNKNCEQKNPQSVENFYKRSDTKCGLYSRCKDCCYLSDQKRISKTRKYKEKWALANPENKKSYYENNKEKILKRMREKYSTPEGKLKTKNNNLKKFYGINLEQYNKMLISQNHKCGICEIDEVLAGKKGLFVDHNHTSGQVRSLLCSKCNFLIGLSKENSEILRKAADYLEKYNESNNVIVLGERNVKT